VYFIPQLTTNILSVSQLDEAWYKVDIYSGVMKICELSVDSCWPVCADRQAGCMCSTSTSHSRFACHCKEKKKPSTGMPDSGI
jgi:hypothetical protein